MNLQQIATASTAVDLVEIENGKPITTSLKVAEIFGKDHKHVIRDIREKVLPYRPGGYTLRYKAVSAIYEDSYADACKKHCRADKEPTTGRNPVSAASTSGTREDANYKEKER